MYAIDPCPFQVLLASVAEIKSQTLVFESSASEIYSSYYHFLLINSHKRINQTHVGKGGESLKTKIIEPLHPQTHT